MFWLWLISDLLGRQDIAGDLLTEQSRAYHIRVAPRVLLRARMAGRNGHTEAEVAEAFSPAGWIGFSGLWLRLSSAGSQLLPHRGFLDDNQHDYLGTRHSSFPTMPGQPGHSADSRRLGNMRSKLAPGRAVLKMINTALCLSPWCIFSLSSSCDVAVMNSPAHFDDC